MYEIAPPAGSSLAPVCAAGCPLHAARAPLFAAAGWLAAAVAALSVATIPFDAGESLCGVWGCFPPLPPLAAMHLLWGVVLAAGVWAVRRWRQPLLRPAGGVLVVAALGAAAVVLCGDVARWVGRVPAEVRHFWPRRVGYLVVTKSDLPLVQAATAGVVCLFLGRRGASTAARKR